MNEKRGVIGAILATAFMFSFAQCRAVAQATGPLIGQGAQAPGAARPSDQAEERGGAYASVPVSVSPSGRLLAPVTIGSSGPHMFIVDTAAERTVIARDIANALQLERAGRSAMLSMTSSRSVQKVIVPRFSFPEGEETTIQAFEFDRENIGAAGVLGIDVLNGKRVVLDFRAQQVRIGSSPARAARAGPNEIVVVGKSKFGQLILADADVGGVHVDVIVDSGLSASLGNESLRRLLSARANRMTLVQYVSITGESLTAQSTQVDKLRLGGIAIAGMPIAFADAYFFKRMRMTRKPTLLMGMDTLQYFDRVTVDFANRRAYFVLPSEGRR